MRAVYLEPFTGEATRKQIGAAYPIAMRLGWISRALSWALVFENLPRPRKERARHRAALTQAVPRRYSFGLTTSDLATSGLFATHVAFAIISVHPGIVSTVVTR